MNHIEYDEPTIEYTVMVVNSFQRNWYHSFGLEMLAIRTTNFARVSIYELENAFLTPTSVGRTYAAAVWSLWTNRSRAVSGFHIAKVAVASLAGRPVVCTPLVRYSVTKTIP